MIGATFLVIFLCLFIGLLYPSLAIFGYDVYSPKNKTLKTIIRWRKRGRDIWQTHTLYSILQMVAPLIPLSQEAEKKMDDDLARADIPYNAKEYYAKACLSAVGGIIVALIALSMESTLLVIGGILLSVYLFFKNFDQLKDTLSSKSKLLGNEIPMFIRSIESSLHTDRDIIHAIEGYNKIAGVAMKSELSILLADMNTSSVPQALMRFENRMANPEISRMVSILLEAEKGVDVATSLKQLANDMTVMHRQLIQRELDKRPGQMKRSILPAAAILVIVMFYMLIEAVLTSTAGML